jgi:methylated-DNA-protein-cysteine methyltransferase-like protein
MMASLCLRSNIILHAGIAAATGAGIVLTIIKMFPSPGEANYYRIEKIQPKIKILMPSSKRLSKAVKTSSKNSKSAAENIHKSSNKNVASSTPKTAKPSALKGPAATDKKTKSPAKKTITSSNKKSKLSVLKTSKAFEKIIQPSLSKPVKASSKNSKPAEAKISIPSNRTANLAGLKPVKPSGKRDESFFDLVYEVVRQIPKGKVTSYGAIATVLGTKLSARMVGWAMQGAPSKVPAHRVVNRNGMLSGKHHFATPTKMQELLEKEGIKVKNDTIIDFKNHYWDPAKELEV